MTEENIKDLTIIKVPPVNYPAPINFFPVSTMGKKNRHINEFSKQQRGGVLCFSSHSSDSDEAYSDQTSSVLACFKDGFELEPSSPNDLLFTLIMVDFLDATKYLDNFCGMTRFDNGVIFNGVLKTFGIGRVAQYFRQDTTATTYQKRIQKLTEIVQMLCHNLEEAFNVFGYAPKTTQEFLFDFLWLNHPSLDSADFPALDRIRLGQINTWTLNGPGSLEVSFSGTDAGQGFVPIGISDLKKVLTEEGMKDLLLELLSKPNDKGIHIPLEARCH